MKYLLDVNALVALGFADHEFHERVARWVRTESSSTLLSCSITELGFVRVLAQAPTYGLTVSHARTLLLSLKNASVLAFIADNQDVAQLPTWVKAARQITDGHLQRLAAASGAVLATLDGKIPGAYLIPER